ncbi:unnamed protein product [Urochloa decumbens]|uniref:Disease resistance protein At4g27190-like leucine-rich repeats domain-containing protein n=1 Tax=Urochloa decumbens TaxID=240449 RepID=A0ABC9D037_9POAL
MQRAIAMALKLDHTKIMFSTQDEEDDFNGLDEHSRDVIPSVATEIDRTLRDCRFMMIFLNGSDDEVDVTRFGIPQMTEFRNNRMIWTFKRRLLTIHSHRSRIAEKLRYTHLFLSAALVHGEYQINESQFCALVHGEAATIIARHPCMLDIDTTMVRDCCLFDLSLHYNFHSTTRLSWAARSNNFWICDGIIQGDKEMEISKALHQEIRWECDASLLHRVLEKLKPTFLVHATLSDARLARTLWPAIDSYRSRGRLVDVYFNINITSVPVYSEEEDFQPAATHRVLAKHYGDIHGMVGDVPMQDFPEALTTGFDRHVGIAQGSRGLESELLGYIPTRNNLALLMRRCADSLHLHDVSTSVNMPMNEWNYLKHCRVERCTRLDTVFPGTYGFEALETVWASDLLMARSIWSKGDPYYHYSSFRELRHLNLRSCPRLRFMLPVWASSFPRLETLHMIDCGDLRHVFIMDKEHPEVHVAFPNLTTIHLHNLPMLRQICEAQMRMLAPALMTIKIRGCWDLRRLPAMEGRGIQHKKPTVEIEKDVWDALEWDGVEAGHHPSLFEEPRHSHFYKKKLLRGSVLG